MITPHFNLSQNDNYVIIHIKIPPYQQFGNEDIQIDNNTMIYHSHPYFLSLTFENEIAKNGTEKAEIDRLECKLHIYLPKQNKGEVFPNLEILPLFLTKKKVLSRVEVIDTIQNENEINNDEIIDVKVHHDNLYDNDQIEEIHSIDNNSIHINSTLNDINNTNEKNENYLEPTGYNNDTIVIGADQKIREDKEDEVDLFAPQYGFNDKHSSFFKDLHQSSYEIVMLNNPDQSNKEERRKQRLETEVNTFDKDHYICDTFELENEEEILKRSKFWWNQSNEWTSDEREEFTQLPQIELLVDKSDQVQLFKDLFTILFGYVYDQIIMEDSTVESAWTIASLSSVLSYFDRISDVDDILYSCLRRSLDYPMIRNWDISMKVLKETINVMKSERVVLVKMLLRIHKIFKLDELKHYLNYLYLDEFCVWIQSSDDSIRLQLMNTFEMYYNTIRKENCLLPVQDAEQEYIDYISNLDDNDDLIDCDNEERGYLD